MQRLRSLALLLVVLSLGLACRQPAEAPKDSKAPTRSGDPSLRVIANNGFGFSPVGWWLLDIHDDGTATLNGHLRDERRFSIPASQMATLRAALAASDLETLSRHHYGTPVVDAKTCRLRVVRGDRTYDISLSPFRGAPPTPAERREVRQALDLWSATKRAGGILELPDVCSEMLGKEGP